MQSPLLPWEVIERVVGHSGDHRRTLHNFSLTCRSLRPRALCLLVADVHFESNVKIFDFCDFLKAKPYLKPLVRSVAVNPYDFAPTPLLNILLNLIDLTFTRYGMDRNATVLNRSSLTCCKYVGMHIQTLRLSELSFPTYLEFSRALSAFTNVRHLVCSNVSIEAERNQLPGPLHAIRRRLFERLHLLNIDIDFFRLGGTSGYYDVASVPALLLDSGLVRSGVETLTVRPYRSGGLTHPIRCPQLRSLVLKLEFTAQDVADAIVFLKDFHPSGLNDAAAVTVKLHAALIRSINETLSLTEDPGQFEELERTLLRFPKPQVVCQVDSLHYGRISLWTQEFHKRLPVLFQRGAFTLTVGSVIPGAGHNGRIRDLVTSQDGDWVATASDDSTIILWSTTHEAMARQWIAHNYRPVQSLAFSPDNQYLASGGADSKLKIWGLAEGSRQVATLVGHTKDITSCAWSPSGGNIVASASHDRTVRLWDARTFQCLRVLGNFPAAVHIPTLVRFSPDGRWLVSGCLHYDVWHVASGTLHRSSRGRPFSYPGPLAAVFDPAHTTRLAIVSGRDGELLDVETGERITTLPSVDMTADVAFSPNGTLVVTGSDNGMVRTWDARTGVRLLSFRAHEKNVTRACFSPCGKYIASASADGTVLLWKTRDGSCMAKFSEHNSLVSYVAFSPNGETLWSGDDDGTVIMHRMRNII